MINTIDMQNMRYLNLFASVTKIQTRFCFMYNEILIFCVPKHLVFKAIGEGGKNAKKLQTITGKKIKIIPLPENIEKAKEFIENIINPVTFNRIEIKDDTIILTAGMQSKSALIGRNKRRFLEMQKIIKSFFKKDFKIV